MPKEFDPICVEKFALTANELNRDVGFATQRLALAVLFRARLHLRTVAASGHEGPLSWLMLTHGSLVSGIGGFDLGFSRTGVEPVWQDHMLQGFWTIEFLYAGAEFEPSVG